MKNKKYRIKGDSPYFKKRYGTPNPIFEIEAKDTDMWEGGWIVSKVAPCHNYAIRVAEEYLPLCGIVYYGHIGHIGELVHETELGEELIDEPVERPIPLAAPPEPVLVGLRA